MEKRVRPHFEASPIRLRGALTALQSAARGEITPVMHYGKVFALLVPLPENESDLQGLTAHIRSAAGLPETPATTETTS